MWWHSVCPKATVRQCVFSSPVGLIYPKFLWTTSSANSKVQQMALCYKEILPWCQLPSSQVCEFRGESPPSLCLGITLPSSCSCGFSKPSIHLLYFSWVEVWRNKARKRKQSFMWLLSSFLISSVSKCLSLPVFPGARIILMSALALYTTGWQ